MGATLPPTRKVRVLRTGAEIGAARHTEGLVVECEQDEAAAAIRSGDAEPYGDEPAGKAKK